MMGIHSHTRIVKGGGCPLIVVPPAHNIPSAVMKKVRNAYNDKGKNVERLSF
jgi:hypothetical protein